MVTLEAELADDILRITLPAVVDLPAAAALRARLLAGFEAATVKVDSAGVAQMTTPGVQTLLAAAAFVRTRPARWVLANPSEALVAAFSDLGLFAQLMAWDAE
jgi:anti-anti-sigma regulatory factor